MTTETKVTHTPGPWKVDELLHGGKGFSIRGIDGTSVCNSGWMANQCRSWAEAKANAHVIATAPDLLEALGDLLSAAEIFAQSHDSCAADPCQLCHAIELGDAAIAKAKGGAE